MNDHPDIPFGNDPFPKSALYRFLYEREIIHTPPSVLLNLAEGGRLFSRGILDVGCGTGRLSLEAKEAGGYPVALDCAQDLPDETEMEIRNIPVLRRRMQDYIVSPDYEPFDIVACQNGIEYWITDTTGGDLSKILRLGGLLLFNMSVEPPSDEPLVERWMGTDERERVETLWKDGDIVRRIIVSGNRYHRTSYPYVSEADIHRILGKNFNIRKKQDHNDGIIFSCQRMR